MTHAMTDIDRIPKPIVAGTEMDALARFYPDVTWTGIIKAGGMGPGTPEQIANGWGKHERIQDGRWIVGTYQQDQRLLDGTFVLRWELHWVVGWDPANGEYRATLADNYGHADVMRGHINGDQLVFESMGNAPVRLRLTWDASDLSHHTWRNEVSIGGGAWSLVEDYHMIPAQTVSPDRTHEFRD
jgi:hypothetical protein